MWYQELIILLIIVEGLLILISLKYLRTISLVSKDFSMVFNEARKEISSLLKEVKELIIVTNRREDNVLSIRFHLEEIEVYVKKILSKIEQQTNYNAEADKVSSLVINNKKKDQKTVINN